MEFFKTDIPQIRLSPHPFDTYEDAKSACRDPGLSKLSDIIAREKWPENDLAELVRCICTYLKANTIQIPSTTTKDLSFNFWHATLALANLTTTLRRCESSLDHINAPKGFISPAWHQTLDAVLHEWPNICQWLEYFTSQCLEDPKISSLDVPSRVFTFTSVLAFFYPCIEPRIFESSHPLRRLISTCATKVSSQLWFLLHENPACLGSYLGPSPIYVLHAGILGMEDRSKIGQQLKEWIGKKTRKITAACIAQLESTSESLVSEIGLGDLHRSVMLIDLLTSDASLGRRLTRANSTQAVVRVLKHVTRKPFDPRLINYDVAIIEACYRCLLRLIPHADGIFEVIRALETGILPTLFRVTTRWQPHLHNTIDVISFLKDVLPAHLVYISVLRVVAKELKKVEKLALEDQTRHEGPLWDAWMLFKKAAEDRIEAAGKLVRRVCDNPQCNHSDSRGNFHRCAGCLEVYYCSRECQRRAWVNGDHRTRCKEVHAFRRSGLRVDISNEDSEFVISIVKRELCKYWRDFVLAWQAHHPHQRPILSFDYSKLPVNVSTKSDNLLDAELPDLRDRKGSVLVLIKLMNGGCLENVHFFISPGASPYDADGSLEKLRKAMNGQCYLCP